MRRIPPASWAALAAVAAIVWLGQAGCKSYNNEEIKSSLELVDVNTSWTMKEYRQWPNPKLTLVPTVTFKIKNNSAETLKYINVNAIFKEGGAVENLGDSFLAAIRGEGLAPGATSPLITLKSNFGVAGKNLDDFKINPQWKSYIVKLFVQMGGPRHVPMGEFPVSRQIDFKEDPAVHQGPPPAGAPAGEVNKD